MAVKRVYVEKRDEYAFEARDREKDFRTNLGIPVEKVRVLHRYDVEGLDDEEFQRASADILSDGATEDIYYEDIPDIGENDQVFASEYRPGQFNQRTHSAEQIMALMTRGERPRVRYAKVFVVEGGDIDKIKDYVINKEDAREASLDKFETLDVHTPPPAPVRTVDDFTTMSEEQLEKYLAENKYAMSVADAQCIQEYFKKEKREPTVTELRVIDAYWSDHCRHTTFRTVLDKVEFGDNPMSERAKQTYKEYLQARKAIGDREPISLMDLATMYQREAKYSQRLQAYDDSDDSNIASFRQIVETDDNTHKYLVMFKNETGNSRTEADPLGGAATCLGGVIRDPLVERAYTYQAMRVAGSGDPREPASEAVPGHLPQRVLSRQSARGFSNYSRGVGVPTGLADELYHPGYKAKHMEIGAVIAAVPEEYVRRAKPKADDVVILLGGRTGRDGVGQATDASAFSHTDSAGESGLFVQKGNPPTERKLQRLFMNEDFTERIKRANDFGAGGVSIAVAELVPGADVSLDEMPVKYPGLDGTELAISESQERIAIVVAPEDEDAVMKMAAAENIRANRIAKVTDDKRLKLRWNGKVIVDLSMKFLESDGAPQHADADVDLSSFENPFQEKVWENFEQTLLNTMSDVNVASKKGMQDMFDSTVGAGTIAMPLGGKHQITPIQAMSATIPCQGEISNTATLMSYGLDPYLMEANPFGGAVYALVDSIAKVVASGGSVHECWLSLQEYFPYLHHDPRRWGQPLAALLGAYLVEKGLHIAAIGGKDSMNGTNGELEVPPTLCSFCVAPIKASQVITPEFKKAGNKLYVLDVIRDDNNLPVFADLDRKYENLHSYIADGKVVSAYAVGRGGYLAGAAKSALGTDIGVKFYGNDLGDMVAKKYGSILVEAPELSDPDYVLVGELTEQPSMEALGETVALERVAEAYLSPLDSVFPRVKESEGTLDTPIYEKAWTAVSKYPTAVPRAVIPVFPGTTCEYDTWKAMQAAGARCQMIVIRNESPSDLQESIALLASEIESAQMIIIPGGSSAADEPDGSGKMIATTFRSGPVYDATMELLNMRDGLILGISNGFQGLIRLGLLPFGEIRQATYESPTLTLNEVGRTVSTIVQVRVTSANSPWLQFNNPGEIHSVIISDAEGRFMAPKVLADQLARNGQIAAQYVDPQGQPTMDPRYNPSGSMLAVESLMSPNGRILGVMGHWERMGKYTAPNVPSDPDLSLFEGGVAYFS